MKIILFSDADSIHTFRWATSLASRGMKIVVCSLRPTNKDYKQIKVHVLADYSKFRNKSLLQKLPYLTIVPQMRKILKKENPNILHAHYASSYGFLASWLKFEKTILTVWGSDIFEFPQKNTITKTVLKTALKRPKLVLSSSHVMAQETLKYTTADVRVIPFGTDVDKFREIENNSENNTNEITIGIVKSLEKVYGIKYLLHAVQLLKQKKIPFRLLIGGTGSQQENLQQLSEQLSLQNHVEFLGRINHDDLPQLLNKFNLFAVPSLSESFGVAAVEASACGLPVVASNVGGLPEVIVDGETGIIVPSKNPQALANAIEQLINSPELRKYLGENGRKRVVKNYNWNTNVAQMIAIYNEIENE